MNYVTLKKEIVEQEKIIAEYPESSKKSASYFYLALLYAHYNNPKPDYSRSLKMFEEYLLFNPENYKKDEALYLSTLLQEIVKTDRELSLLKTEARRIKQDSVKLKAKNKQLVLENQNLGDSIEKLKLLELTLEEKRLNFK